MMLFSYSHRFIFFCNGKTASTSVEHAMSSYHDCDNYHISAYGLFNSKHVPPRFIEACVPSKLWNECFKFAFVRNPWDWVVSNWKYNFEHMPVQRRKNISLWQQAKRIVLSQKSDLRVEYRDVLSVKDVETLYNYLGGVRVIPSAQTAFQYPYVFDSDGKQQLDFVGRFEHLDRDFRIICNRLGLNLKLPRLNYTNRGGYKTYFNNASRQAVAELWEKDIAAFGYSYD